jgi:hypothetical protein
MQEFRFLGKSTKNCEKFTTGKRCKHGHKSPRYATNGQCIKCIHEKYKKNKKEILKKQRERYWMAVYGTPPP